MVVKTVYTLALHCPYCGKIETHDISPFMPNDGAGIALVCSCGHIHGRVKSVYHQQYVLELPCVLCQTNHILCLDAKKIKEPGVKKLYCPAENLELGFFGERESITCAMLSERQEVETLLKSTQTMECGEEDIENSLVMLEVLNRIHDIAEQGRLYCHCGSKQIEVEFCTDSILLRCAHCHGWTIVPAVSKQDSEQIKTASFLEIASPQKFHHKH